MFTVHQLPKGITMSDTIEMIEYIFIKWRELGKRANGMDFTHHEVGVQFMDFYNSEQASTMEAALSVLKKIASGEDWFDIEDMPLNKRILVTDGENIGDGRYNGINFIVSASNDICDASGIIGWKHIDGAKHVEMLMERELNDQ